MSDYVSLSPHDPYEALRLPAFRRYMSGNLLAILGMQMQSVAVGWEVYERTGQTIYLALVGLCQVAPVLALGLFAGHVADRFDRRTIIVLSLSAVAAASSALAVISYLQGPLWCMYACLVATGVARAFLQPAKSSLLPLIVPSERFANAVTWSSGTFQLAAVAGPALAGRAIALGHMAWPVYAIDACAAVSFIVMILGVRYERRAQPEEASSVDDRSLLAGIAFLWANPVILAAISLDLFAVLLGGATALLPVFAKDILQVGPSGLGYLQAAPAVGALAMALVIAHRPPMERAGLALLLSVVGFGAATIVFGLSSTFWLSLAALAVTGALDAISVVVRHSLVQLLTPDAMRGRVSAVNGMFISASNELGAFESGLLAAITSATFSVVAGGAGTIAVVLVVATLCPQLRRFGRIGTSPAQRFSPSPSTSLQ